MSAEFVGLAVGESAPDTRANEERGECPGEMIATFAVRIVDPRGAAEFSAASDQGFGEQPTLFEVLDQGGDGLIDAASFGFVIRHVTVRIPVIMGTGIDEFDDADAAFDEAAGDQALPGEGAAVALGDSVLLKCGGVFGSDIENGRCFRHHALSDIEAVHAGAQVRGIGELAGLRFVEIAEHGQFKLAERGRARRGRQVWDGIVARDDPDALVVGRKKIAVPNLGACVRGMLGQDNERGEVAIERAEAIAEP